MKMNFQKHKNTFIHIAAWLAFFSLPFVISLLFSGSDSEIPPPPIHQLENSYALFYFVLVHIFIVIFYYINTNILITKLLLKKKIFYYTLSILACYLLFIYNFKPLIVYVNPKTGFSPPQEVVNVVSKLIGTLIFLLILLVSTGIRLTRQWYETEKQRISIEKEKVETELSFLKAQINPHFLFNTLNSIYTLALKKSEQTPSAVMQLSNMMRYVTTEAKSDFVSLEKELQYVRHFIDLQQLRLPKNMTLHTEIVCENQDTPIAPLLLIPFIENAFKYGVSTRENAMILISILVKNNNLEMHIENQKFHSLNEVKDKTGIGLENTKQRLELLYKNRYKLIINDLENKYKVRLMIKLLNN